MKKESIEIGKTYRMRGRKLDRRVVDILSLPDRDKAGNYRGEYQVVVSEVVGEKPERRTVREFLPWFADDAIRAV